MWVKDVFFHNEHFDAIRGVVNGINSAEDLAVCQCKEAFIDSGIRKDTAVISTHFSHIPASIKKLETQGSALNECIQLMNKIILVNSILQEVFSRKRKEKFDNILNNNPGFEL
ncbi:uncharacterized protein LOC126147913 [Schistocerca cancellata]|uniref:uncharacterized protein LOC126147913 n=1 Tax=Schistocerca cancellata TaxID=274614 RepID=UPI002118451B|nr:uncharacterized protein LOC126147913 [Schistocerca cancellata]